MTAVFYDQVSGLHDLTLDRGIDYIFVVDNRNGDSGPVSIVDTLIEFKIYSDDSLTEPPLFQLSSNNIGEVTIVDSELSVTIPEAFSLSAASALWYVLDITNPDSNKFRILRGNVIIV